MKSLMLRSSRAFLGGGGFLGLWVIAGDICVHTHTRPTRYQQCRQNVLFVGKSRELGYRGAGGREARPNQRHHGNSNTRCPRLFNETHRTGDAKTRVGHWNGGCVRNPSLSRRQFAWIFLEWARVVGFLPCGRTQIICSDLNDTSVTVYRRRLALIFNITNDRLKLFIDRIKKETNHIWAIEV